MASAGALGAPDTLDRASEARLTAQAALVALGSKEDELDDRASLGVLDALGELFPEAQPLRFGPVQAPPPSRTRLTVNASTPDDELALAACEGDPRAPLIIFRRFVMQVRAKLLRWVGGHDLDDHVQEVFSRLFEQLPRLREPSALRSFLIGITLRVACTELRRRRRWRLRLTATGEVPEVVEHVREDGSARQALSRFEDILGKLAPRTRRVFVLRYVEKLELVDVAAAMDISLATAKRHLARASIRVFAMVEREPALVDYLDPMRRRVGSAPLARAESTIC